MPSLYDNHQVEKDFREIKKIKKCSQKNVYIGIANNSLCVCVCVHACMGVCSCRLYLRIVVCGCICDC